MLWLLRLLFLGVLVSMLGVTTWASRQQALFDLPPAVLANPWFIATLLDAAWGFITFYVWVAWKEQSGPARVLWFIAVLGLGNIAMSLYVLRELGRVPPGTPLRAVITQRHPGRTLFPGVLVVLTIGVYLLA